MRRIFVLAGLSASLFILGAFAPSSQPTTEITETSFRVAIADDLSDPTYALTEPVPGNGDFVGVTWQSGSPSTVEIRAFENASWTEWRDVSPEADHAPDEETGETLTTRGGSEPTLFESPDAVQVRVAGEVPAGLEISFFDARTSSPLPLVSATAAEAGVTIRPRSDWDPGNACAPRSTPEEIQVDIAFVHHTGIGNTYKSSQVPGVILSYCKYHQNGRGWDDLAYNFMIDRFGTIWEGRAGGIDKGIRGGHTKGVNSFSTGIALLGNFTNTAPSAAQQKSLTDLLTWKLGVHNVDPLGQVDVITEGSYKFDEYERVTFNTIAGHRDAQATACPGSYLYSRLPQIRNTVAAAFTAVPLDTYAPSVTGDFTGDGVEDGAAFVTATRKWKVTSGAAQSAISWSGSAIGLGLVDAARADLDGDSKADIVAVGPGKFVTFRSTGSGFTSSTVAGVANPQRIVQADDGMGQVSIVTDGSGRVMVAPSWATIGTAPGLKDIAVGDVDGDGIDEIVTVGNQGTITVHALGNQTVGGKKIVVPGADRIAIGDFSGTGVETIAAIDSTNGLVSQVVWTGSQLAIAASVDIETYDHIEQAFVSETTSGTQLIVLDAYVGVWKAVRFDGTLSGYTVLEDQPYRTSVVRREVATNKPFLAYYAKEFGWMQMTAGRQQNDESNPGSRISGASRYQTNTLLTRGVYDRSDEVVIATGTVFADALAAGAVAASRDAVLLLSDPKTLPGTVATEIRRLGARNAIVAGGPAAIDDSIVTFLEEMGLTVERVGGVDRFETAVLLSRTTFDASTETVYVATGLNYPDALASVPLAASKRSPVLLVGEELSPIVRSEIQRLQPNRVVILGGTAAVSSKVQSEIAAITTATLTRIAQPDRYGTAVSMSRMAFKNPVDTVFLAVGTNFPDALIAGPVASRMGAPVLLTNPTILPPGVYAEILRLKPTRLIVLGSTGAISEEIFHSLRGLGPSYQTELIDYLPRP
ncbi:MAG: cell wall-binding repeat-containing protein [Actinomycetia bacterium]|nr:cell wall-binding repeat-containing protein [Actinomycetes bacterium]